MNCEFLFFFRPVPCHQIDKATGGLVVCAKTFSALQNVTKFFRERQVKKRYQAVVMGTLPANVEGAILPPGFKWLSAEDKKNNPTCDEFDFSIEQSLSGKAALTFGKVLRQGTAHVKLWLDHTDSPIKAVSSSSSASTGTSLLVNMQLRRKNIAATHLELYPHTGTAEKAAHR